jgi:predicted Na+-dependent transporter
MNIKRYKVFVYIGMITIALGANMLTTWKDDWGSYGTVVIAIGLMFFLIGLRLKREEDRKEKK